jgi:hypothetical protein
VASLAWQKCLNHGDREAVARCPECLSSFCRECVAEHRGRILCAQCLGKLKQEAAAKRGRWRFLGLPVGAAAGLAAAWLVFLLLGKALLLIPTKVHEGAWLKQISGDAQ